MAKGMSKPSKKSKAKKPRKNQAFMPPSGLSPFAGHRNSKVPKKVTPNLFGIPNPSKG